MHKFRYVRDIVRWQTARKACIILAESRLDGSSHASVCMMARVTIPKILMRLNWKNKIEQTRYNTVKGDREDDNDDDIKGNQKTSTNWPFLPAYLCTNTRILPSTGHNTMEKVSGLLGAFFFVIAFSWTCVSTWRQSIRWSQCQMKWNNMNYDLWEYTILMLGSKTMASKWDNFILFFIFVHQVLFRLRGIK